MFVGHPGSVAELDPERDAIVMAGSGDRLTYGELAVRANRAGHLFRSRGLRPGDVVAICMTNHLLFLEVAWAAQLAGLYYTTVNTHLTADEIGYVLADCGASVVVASDDLLDVVTAAGAQAPALEHRFAVARERGRVAPADGWEDYERAVAQQPSGPVEGAGEGDYMLYSSGTTGRPKGIRRALTGNPVGHPPDAAVELMRALGFVEGGTYLSPAPLYHAAPLSSCLAVHRLGGTVVVMERFDALGSLGAIERYRVTNTTMVPTMFVRLLKLPDEQRLAHDLSSLVSVAHAAAPCPVDVKRRMMDWLGPILYEWYGSTESALVTFIGPQDWLDHPGSVGRPMIGEPHILDDRGEPVPVGEVGTVWGAGGMTFEYHADPDRTAEAHDDRGWATVGDVGYVDADGYLYLTDRKDYTIISGGVNIYPQEVEDVLIAHPKVADVAVLGVPHADMGEEVRAVVQPAVWGDAGPELEQELIALCRGRLAAYKCPRRVDFDPALPRADNGKLYKRRLKERYWP